MERESLGHTAKALFIKENLEFSANFQLKRKSEEYTKIKLTKNLGRPI